MDRRILNLMLAVMAYINSKNVSKNPFVKSFLPTDDEYKAYGNMVIAIEDCHEFYPEIEKMIDEIMSSESNPE